MSTGKAATAARAGVILGVTVVALQVLQQVVGAYDPRRILAVVITVTFAAATFALDRLRQRRAAAGDRESRLAEALRQWPLRRVKELDRRRLGVFPGEGDGAYVPRTADAALREAAQEGRFAVVVGPPRAGKSRSALAALDADAYVIAPCDADALRSLPDIDPPPGALVHTVLWLDGLERFVPALDARLLDRLLGSELPPAIVATMRRDAYDELLAGPDEAGRVVAAYATAVSLPRELDERESAAAAAAYPALDVSQGIGPALASTGHDSAAPPPLPPASSAPPDVPGHRSDGLLVAACAATAGGVAAIVLASLLAGFSEPSRTQRLDAIMAPGAHRDVLRYDGDFHGSGSTAHVIVFHDTRVAPGGGAPRPPVSDEIRVYDEQGENGLRRRFTFRPRQPGWVYAFRFIGDVDGDGDAELIGGYGDPRDASQAELPFMLDWDASARRYRLTGLQAAPPSHVGAARPSAQPFLAAYQKRIALTDGATSLTGFRVQDFAFVQPTRLVTGVVLRPRTFSVKGTVELEGNIIHTSGGTPQLVPCRLDHPRSPRVVWETGRRLDVQMAAEWDTLTRTHTCTPLS